VENIKVAGRLFKRKPDYDWVGWTMWIEDFDVDPRCGRKPLEAGAADFDRVVETVRRTLDTLGTLRQLTRFAFSARRVPRVFKNVRKAVTHQRFDGFFEHVIEIAAGRFGGFSAQPEIENSDRVGSTKTWDAALGLKPARTDRINGVGPIIRGEYDTSILRGLSDELEKGPLAKRVAELSDDELKAAAQEVSRLFAVITSANLLMKKIGGKGAFGLARVDQIAAEPSLKVHVMVVLLWAMYRQRRGVEPDTAAFLRATAHIVPLAHAVAQNPNIKPPKTLRVRRKANPWPHSTAPGDSLSA
jgi:hypothetical protein